MDDPLVEKLRRALTHTLSTSLDERGSRSAEASLTIHVPSTHSSKSFIVEQIMHFKALSAVATTTTG